MDNRPCIVSTKKLLPSQKQYLLNAGFGVIEADFIRTTPLDFETEHIYSSLIFTSQNAVNSVLRNSIAHILKTKKIFCVGIKTKQLLESNGFKVMAYTNYASELAQIITEKYNTEKFTFFSGTLRMDTLPNSMKQADIPFNELTVYKTTLTPVKIQPDINGILFFSPSGIESYLQENRITNQTCFCIGTTTAQALKNKTEKIVIASKPTIENVIIKAIKHYNKS